MRAVVFIFDTKAEQEEFIRTSGYQTHGSTQPIMRLMNASAATTLLSAEDRILVTKRRAAVKAKQKAKAKTGRKASFKPDTSLYGQTVKVYRMALDSDRNPAFLREGPLERIDDPFTYVVGGNLYSLNETTDFQRADDGSLELFVIEEN